MGMDMAARLNTVRPPRTILVRRSCGQRRCRSSRRISACRQTRTHETARALSVCHFPPGTSKWNKVEHRLFSFISSNWRGEPLCDYETIVHLIARTTTAKGLQVICRLDRRKYITGRRISDDAMKSIDLECNRFHGDWNYVIRPHRTGVSRTS
jgi:hypothetical protein